MMSEINGRLVVHEIVGRASSREQKYVLSDSASIFSGLTLKQKREVADKFNHYDKLIEENQRLTEIAAKRATRADELCEALKDIYDEAVDYQKRTGKKVSWVESVSLLLEKRTASDSNDD